jgi:hypothetical protein
MIPAAFVHKPFSVDLPSPCRERGRGEGEKLPKLPLDSRLIFL